MKTTTRRMLGFGAAALTGLALACGGGGGGSASSGTSSAASTLSGNVAGSSLALHETAKPMRLARLLSWISPVGDALAATLGIQVGSGGVSATADSTGFFVLDGVPGGSQTVSFLQNGNTFTLNVNLPPGATVVLRDVELQGDGSAVPGQIDVQLNGMLTAATCNASTGSVTLQLAQTTVTVALVADTVVTGPGQSASLTCDALTAILGQQVHVEAETQADGSFVAERIHIGGDTGGTADDIFFRGTASASGCPTSITVSRGDGEPITVTLDANTQLDGVTDCAGLDGLHVKVRGALNGDGSVTAHRISVETESERECEGRRGFGEGHGPGPSASPTETESEPTPTPTPSV